ncbi:hypothetical protein MUG84_00205 [Paenibacillus sp. KQZ6P-2]|uniref:Uncharacterized protein n=1 Tax=Paenibacillus mangrovi TaxID=2931978 RepID=A0A9X1WIU1_9BACL|nr:hypothetical protein [Paenibacillus mangrovi]MCJ8010162.1 hypothetical protein [Paenibacillus mangrovi]
MAGYRRVRGSLYPEGRNEVEEGEAFTMRNPVVACWAAMTESAQATELTVLLRRFPFYD